jgi:hypothetical protein
LPVDPLSELFFFGENVGRRPGPALDLPH